MQQAEILSLVKLRVDGRKYDQIRQIRSKISIITNADGSAYYEQVKHLRVILHFF